MTIFVAIYAALISTGALLWQIYSWSKNRYKLSLMIGRHQIYANGIESPPSEEVVLRIANVGRDPVALISHGFECDRCRSKEDTTLISYYTYDRRRASEHVIKPLQQAEWFEYSLPVTVLEIGRVRVWAQNADGRMFTSSWLDTTGEVRIESTTLTAVKRRRKVTQERRRKMTHSFGVKTGLILSC